MLGPVRRLIKDSRLSRVVQVKSRSLVSYSFGSPYADVVSATVPDEEASYNVELSYATPYADFCSSNIKELKSSDFTYKEVEKSMSYSTPFSDFMKPSLYEINSNTTNYYEDTNLSFSSPESDYTANNLYEMNEERIETWGSSNISFSSPESDYCAPLLSEQLESEMVANDIDKKYSYATAYSDFVQPNLLKYHEDLPMTREAVGLQEPSLEARVITTSTSPFQIVAVNRAWEGLCGFTSHEAVGQTLGLLQGNDTNLQTLESLSVTASKGFASTTVLKNYNKDGDMFKNRLRIQPLDDGTLLGVLEKIDDSDDDLEDGKHYVLGMAA